MSSYQNILKPWNGLEPFINSNEEFPLRGRNIPPTRWYSGNLGLHKQLGSFQISASTFLSLAKNAYIWYYGTDVALRTSIRHSLNGFNAPIGITVNQDSLITPVELGKLNIAGGSFSARYDLNSYRITFSLFGTRKNQTAKGFQPVTFREPNFRMLLETGWHRTFFNGDFEADILMSGKYFNSFFYYSKTDSGETETYLWRTLTQSYPLEFRLTARIKRFTLYYGVHNWNSYQYEQIPDYKMIHREEYWGIDWMLLN